MRPARTFSWRLFTRRLCAAGTLLAYLCAVVGVPVPARAARPQGAAFPCQMLGCGCQTAKDCDGCGCATPPAPEPEPEPKPAEPAPACCCCKGQESTESCGHCAKKQPARSCCAAPTAAPTKAAATPKKSCGSCQQAPKDNDGKEQTGLRWAGISAWRCHGVTPLWVGAAASTPAAPPVAWQPVLTFSGWLAQANQTSVTLSFDLLDPPPRA
jgi:hypothetical protein